MKRLVVLLVSILVLAWVPGLVSAQGFLPPGLPSLGSGGSSYYGYDKQITVVGDIGYVCQSHAADLSFEAEGAGFLPLGANGWKQSFPVQGALLGATASFATGGGLTFLGRGTWLFASGGESYENYKFGAGAGERKWGAKPQWWTLEGAAAYGLNGSSAVIGGLRYDSFEVSFDNPSNYTIAGLPTDQADLRFSAWIPFAGVVAKHGGAKFGLVGSPWLPGSLKYGQTLGGTGVRYDGSGAMQSGYLLEAFGEYAVNLAGVSAGLYAKWTLAHGTTKITADRLGGTESDTFSVSLERQNWILGASAAMSFYSPL